MCGIFGFVGKRTRAESIDLGVAIRSLHHRGPDDNGTYFGVSKSDPDIACAFAHTRLSIIDLSAAGHQPMTTDDGRYTMVYNGEIYNFRELRAELLEVGVTFESQCDSEIVLKGFRAWGKDVVKRLRGMFSFAVWDAERGVLFFARDRFGIKPFYYCRYDGGLAFGSEVRALMDTGCAERRLSEGGLRSYFHYGSVSDPETIVRNVVSLLPGQWGELVRGELRIESYWTLHHTDGEHRDYHDAVDSIRSTLDSAVAEELVADVPLGIFLSGGVDSSVVTAIASRAQSLPVHTFNVTFDELNYNEERFAAEVAGQFGCEHHQVRLTGSRVASEIDRLLGALDQPSSDGVNTFFVAEAAREAGLAVALSGMGGDEVFAGYQNFGLFTTVRRLAALASPLRHWFNGSSPDVPSFGARTNRRLKLADLVAAGGEPLRTYAALRSMFTGNQRRALLGALAGSGTESSGVREPEYNSTDSISFFSALELANYLPNTLLRDTDVMSMAHSLEVRVPLLDHELVEQAMKISGHFKRKGGLNKQLLLDAAGDLPFRAVNRRKMGFVLPLDKWFRGPMKDRVSELLLGEPCRRLGFLNPHAVKDLWSAFLRGQEFVSYSRVWCVAAFSGWAMRNRMNL